VESQGYSPYSSSISGHAHGIGRHFERLGRPYRLSLSKVELLDMFLECAWCGHIMARRIYPIHSPCFDDNEDGVEEGEDSDE
jgi:hypothetical protein